MKAFQKPKREEADKSGPWPNTTASFKGKPFLYSKDWASDSISFGEKMCF